MAKGALSLCNDLVLRLLVYGIIFILAFWCAAIAAPIMWRLETDREHGWPVVDCTVVSDNCCRVSCGKSGCSYQPDWGVSLTRTDPNHEGEIMFADYYGKTDQWYKPREAAENAMQNHPVGTTFRCQYDINYPQPYDTYRTIVLEGDFFTETYLIWTICMYAIGIPLCILPLIGYGIYMLAKNCGCRFGSCDCGCDCLKRRRKFHQRHTIAPPTPYTPPAPTVAPTSDFPVEEVRVDPFAGRNDAPVVENPILVPLTDVAATSLEVSHSGSASGSGEMPAY